MRLVTMHSPAGCSWKKTAPKKKICKSEKLVIILYLNEKEMRKIVQMIKK